jgi:hypothetical protein
MTSIIRGSMEQHTQPRYAIIEKKDIEKINFSKVMQTSPLSMRYSLDGLKTFVKYKGEQPDFCYAISQNALGLQEYSHEDFLKILEGKEWTKSSE